MKLTDNMRNIFPVMLAKAGIHGLCSWIPISTSTRWGVGFFRVFLSLGMLLLLASPSLAFDGMRVAIPQAAFWGMFRFEAGLKGLLSPGQGASGSQAIHEAFATSAKSFGDWKNLRRKKKGSAPALSSQKWSVSWSCEDLAENLARVLSERGMVPETLFFFYKNQGEYVVVLSGTIHPGRLRAMVAPERLVERPDGFALVETASSSARILRVGDGYALLCPAGYEGNVVDMLTSETLPPGEQYATFRKMLEENPTLALEINLSEFIKSFPDACVPYPLDNVELFRMIIGQKVMKIQAYAPNDQARIFVAQLAKSLVEVLQGKAEKSSADKSPSPPLNGGSFWMHRNPRFFTYGKSVFLDCVGLQDRTAHGQASLLGGLAALVAENIQKSSTSGMTQVVKEARLPPDKNPKNLAQSGVPFIIGRFKVNAASREE